MATTLTSSLPVLQHNGQDFYFDAKSDLLINVENDLQTMDLIEVFTDLDESAKKVIFDAENNLAEEGRKDYNILNLD
jgi:hypothetical protein